MKEKTAIIIVFALILILIPLVVLIITMPSKSILKQTNKILDPSPSITNTAVVPASKATDGETKFLEYVKNRRTLSESDATAKKQILALLPPEEDSGVLYQTSTISIEYVYDPDLFQVEILTTNTQKAKNEATTWFKEKGLSQEGICYLPVQFYLNYAIAKTIPNASDTFNPLAPGC